MSDGFAAWAHLEAMGHRGHWGLMSEKQIAGASFLQIECFKIGVAEAQGVFLYPPASIYCITPCTEERARTMTTPYGERPASAELEAGQQPWSGMDVVVDVEDEDEDDYADVD